MITTTKKTNLNFKFQISQLWDLLETWDFPKNQKPIEVHHIDDNNNYHDNNDNNNDNDNDNNNRNNNKSNKEDELET